MEDTHPLVSHMKRMLIIVVLLISILYVCDYGSVRYRIPRTHDPFGIVKIQRYYAVPKKNGKPDFYFEEPENQTCVHSLFPQLGYIPCWYLNRKKAQRIDF